MRGKVYLVQLYCGFARITPAYAGKSASTNADRFSVQDHPRVCGEKTAITRLLKANQGSPPRVRGKAGLVQIVGRLRRITPACAGKSTCMAQSLKPREHHPRVCGEKQKSGIFPFRLVGSPPRMRGKAFLCVAQAFAGGITPAYAGKRSARSAACLAG